MDAANNFSDYDVESDIEAFERALSVYNKRSEASFARLTWQRDLAYGEHPDQRLDIASPGTDSDRIAIFFHGGWWRSGRKEGRAFLADEFLALGYHFVNVEYPLAPAAELSDIISSAERALAYTYKYFSERDTRPKSLAVAGNSAGGHLAACVCSKEALARASIPPNAVVSMLCVSGIFDLRPLIGLEPSEWLKLNDGVARACSPVEFSYAETLKVRLIVGGDEPKGFATQTEMFESLLKRRGLDVRSHIDPGHDHMQIIARTPRLFQQLR
jgi:arylformamidase